MYMINNVVTFIWFITHLPTTATVENVLFFMLSLMLFKQCRKFEILPTHFAIEPPALCTIFYLQDLAKTLEIVYIHTHTTEQLFSNLSFHETYPWKIGIYKDYCFLGFDTM
jgi:hypothetical protein